MSCRAPSVPNPGAGKGTGYDFGLRKWIRTSEIRDEGAVRRLRMIALKSMLEAIRKHDERSGTHTHARSLARSNQKNKEYLERKPS